VSSALIRFRRYFSTRRGIADPDYYGFDEGGAVLEVSAVAVVVDVEGDVAGGTASGVRARE